MGFLKWAQRQNQNKFNGEENNELTKPVVEDVEVSNFNLINTYNLRNKNSIEKETMEKILLEAIHI